MSKITKAIWRIYSRSSILEFDDESIMIVKMRKSDLHGLALRVGAEFVVTD